MTGNFNGGQVNPLSRLTVAAFEDLGYEVDYAAADPYRNLLPDQDALDTEIHNVAFNFPSTYPSAYVARRH